MVAAVAFTFFARIGLHTLEFEAAKTLLENANALDGANEALVGLGHEGRTAMEKLETQLAGGSES